MSNVDGSQVSQQDVVILGAGVFGLLLAYQLLGRMGNHRHIWLVDHRRSYDTDKTFGFFCAKERIPTVIQPLIDRSFERWALSRSTQKKTVQATHMAYHVLSSSNLYQQCSREIESAARITRCLGKDADQFLRNIPKQQGMPLVIDTRPSPPSNFRVDQRFVGGEWVSEQPHALEQPTLMGNMRVVDGVFLFDYLIPLDAFRLLVQVTAFYPQYARTVVAAPIDTRAIGEPAIETSAASNEACELDSLLHQELQHYIEQSPMLNRMRMTRVEGGSIPMGLLAAARTNEVNPRYFRLASRQVTSFSGYGFLNAVTLSGHFARVIAENPRLDGVQLDALLRESLAHCQFPFSAMSDVFLQVIERHQIQLPEVFWRLGTQVSADQFAQFLGTPTKRSAAAMIRHAPKRLFAAAALSRFLADKRFPSIDVTSDQQLNRWG